MKITFDNPSMYDPYKPKLFGTFSVLLEVILQVNRSRSLMELIAIPESNKVSFRL
jgi:hypothetical protein